MQLWNGNFDNSLFSALHYTYGLRKLTLGFLHLLGFLSIINTAYLITMHLEKESIVLE